MTTDLKAKPFFLSEEDVKWVKETIAEMSIEEKIGQLFINLGKRGDESYIRDLVENYHIGGVRFTETDAEKIYEQNKMYQQFSKIPVLIAANCETGGDGACKQGTFVASEAQCASTGNIKAAYEMGRISGIEATAIGCNWTYGPMVDILFNWRNTIVNTRAFGNEPNDVMNMAKAYIEGVHKSNMLACAKHFPGDGVDERDHHLVMGCNDLTCEEWDDSFGKVYKELIDSGVESIMIGHIALPSYSKRFKPDITLEEIMPATLSPELVTDLLRKQLGFNGLVLTDASHMGGLISTKPRSEQVPGAIAAGCDMFLFFHDVKEDFQYMMDGYKKGIITEERLQDALEHILGMKAKLKLHKTHATGVYAGGKDKLSLIGCKEHRDIAKTIADDSITLVKDAQKLLPININNKKRARLYYLESEPVSYASGTDPAKKIVIEELEKAGFELDVNESYYEMEEKGASPFNKFRAMELQTVEDFKEKYDVIFVFVHMKGYAQ